MPEEEQERRQQQKKRSIVYLYLNLYENMCINIFKHFNVMVFCCEKRRRPAFHRDWRMFLAVFSPNYGLLLPHRRRQHDVLFVVMVDLVLSKKNCFAESDCVNFWTLSTHSWSFIIIESLPALAVPVWSSVCCCCWCVSWVKWSSSAGILLVAPRADLINYLIVLANACVLGSACHQVEEGSKRGREETGQ